MDIAIDKEIIIMDREKVIEIFKKRIKPIRGCIRFHSIKIKEGREECDTRKICDHTYWRDEYVDEELDLLELAKEFGIEKEELIKPKRCNKI